VVFSFKVANISRRYDECSRDSLFIRTRCILNNIFVCKTKGIFCEYAIDELEYR